MKQILCGLNGETYMMTNPAVTPKQKPIIYSEGASRIYAERQRQVQVEGYDGRHDVEVNNHSELAIAAACYALPRTVREQELQVSPGIIDDPPPSIWPWDDEYWKPGTLTPSGPIEAIKDRIRELEKAGALIAAEIDRLLDMLPEGYR